MTFLLSLSVVVAFVYLAGHFVVYRRWPALQPQLLVLLILALSVRWLFLLAFPNPAEGDLRFEAVSYELVADLVRDGRDVYAETGRYPYLPFQMYIFAFAGYLGDHLELSNFFSWVRLPERLRAH